MYQLADVNGVRVRMSRAIPSLGTTETMVEFVACSEDGSTRNRLAAAMRAQADLLDPPYAAAIESALKSEDLRDAIRHAITTAIDKATSK